MNSHRLLPALLVALLAIPTLAAAQNVDCLDYRDHLHWSLRQTTPDDAVAIRRDGDRLYVCCGSAGLVIYDISFPESPVLLGIADTPYFCREVIVSGDRAYVGDWWNPGFCVVDVSDPTDPVVLGTCGAGSNPYFWDLALVDPDTVYVADLHVGVRVIDVADPTAPQIVGTFGTGGYVWSIDAADGYAYVGDDISGVHVYDASVAIDPQWRATVSMPGPSYDLDVADDFAYVACGDAGLQIIDISDPLDPSIVGSFEDITGIEHVRADGDRAYLVRSGGSSDLKGLIVVDVTDRSAPALLGTLTIDAHEGLGVAPAGDIAYVAADDYGLMIADASTPTPPPIVATHEFSHPTSGVTTSGQHAYVLDPTHGITILDISDPFAVVVIDSLAVPGQARDLEVQGDLGYLCDGSLRMLDLSSPAAPVFIGHIDPFGTAEDVAVAGDLALLAAGSYGLQIIDTSTPTDPVEIATLDPGGAAFQVAVHGHVVYLAGGFYGLHVIDFADPAAPVAIQTIASDEWTVGVAVAGGRLCVIEQGVGVQLYDLTDPEAPAWLTTLAMPGDAAEIVSDGRLAYAATELAGLHVIDLGSGQSLPRLIGALDTPGHSAMQLDLASSVLAVADFVGGLHLLWPQCTLVPVADGLPAAGLSLTAYPNPFNPRLGIEFTLTRSGRAIVDVHDLTGRRLRRIVDTVLPGGTHHGAWDGRDAAGRPMPSGTYVLRLHGDQRLPGRKVTLLR